mmetsp:Transcript_17903/g.52313  ORF Transcript_17903/g.52313 Transcript_17903/m.52313 type:complete len:215 (-) Transcript_17903:252-896(-)
MAMTAEEGGALGANRSVKRTWTVRLGSSWRGQGEDSGVVSLRYERKPVGVSTGIPGSVLSVKPGNQISVSVPSTGHAQEDPGGVNFSGKLDEASDLDCVLVLRPDTGAVLEKIRFSVSGLRPSRGHLPRSARLPPTRLDVNDLGKRRPKQGPASSRTVASPRRRAQQPRIMFPNKAHRARERISIFVEAFHRDLDSYKPKKRGRKAASDDDTRE